ncbi:hypothetical protein GQ457_03G014200 [Hibiscus cannabinus]
MWLPDGVMIYGKLPRRKVGLLSDVIQSVVVGRESSTRELGAIRVLSWNVWGLGSSVKRKTIRIVLRKQRIETVCVPAFSGVIGWFDIFLEISKCTLHGVCRDSCFLLVSGVWVVDEWTCGMIVVYVPCETGEQLVCWHSLTALIASLALPNCVSARRGMVAFIEFIEKVGLLNFLASGSKFTWHGGDSKIKASTKLLNDLDKQGGANISSEVLAVTWLQLQVEGGGSLGADCSSCSIGFI